jgi:hypothetical protein
MAIMVLAFPLLFTISTILQLNEECHCPYVHIKARPTSDHVMGYIADSHFLNINLVC